MRKLTALLLVLVLCLSFAACTSSEDEPQKEQNSSAAPSSEASTPEDVTFGTGDTAAFESLKFTANEIKESTGDEFFAPEEGKIFVGVKFTIENVSSEEQTISTLMLFEAYANDVKCDYSVSASVAFDEGTLDGTIGAGKKLVGWYAVEVPEDWTTLEIDIKPDILSDSKAEFIFNK